jgi:hypothetical protein
MDVVFSGSSLNRNNFRPTPDFFSSTTGLTSEFLLNFFIAALPGKMMVWIALAIFQ